MTPPLPVYDTPLHDHLGLSLPVARRSVEALEEALSAQESRAAPLRSEEAKAKGLAPRPCEHVRLQWAEETAEVPLLTVAATHCWIRAPSSLQLGHQVFIEGVFGLGRFVVQVTHRFAFADAAVLELTLRT